MENDSPLKSWVRRHSPLRNKPLPAPPPPDAEIENPLKAISGNTSPSKKPSTSRLRSFLRPKPQPHSPPRRTPSPPQHHPNSRDGRGRAVPLSRGPDGRHFSKSLRPRQRSVDLRGLSRKISSLEAQLEEARKQLDSVAQETSTSLYTPENHHKYEDGRQEIEHQHRQDNDDQQSFAHRQEYERLVKELMDQRERDNGLGLARKSNVNLATPHNEIRTVQDTSDDEGACVSDSDTRRHKRKRSEVRQASWDMLQSHLQKQQQLRQQVPEPKRLRHSRGRSLDMASPRSKILPELPELPIPNRGDRSTFVIQDMAKEEADNKCPPLNRDQFSFSHAPSKRHQRRQSQIIGPEQLREAFGQAPADSPNKQNRHPSTDIQVGPDDSPPRAKPSSPNRRKLSSPSRLDKVEEEFEWDEDIF